MDGKKASEIQLDFDRPERIGLGEAVYCQHKSIEQLYTIVEQLLEAKKGMLFTRLAESIFFKIEKQFPKTLDYDPVSRTAFLMGPNIKQANSVFDIAIVTGGSSDVAIGREVARTLEFAGVGAIEINDVGVAGLWRLQQRLEDIKNKKVVICVAGMDAALPTVLGGLISSVIIAVPSSVGYGVADGGKTALNALLCSCAPGLVVVNIDNGYGAACAALRILNS